ncbi:MAG: hypothetical protein NT155_03680 [Candidatus Staskawiczbacteria bacterium]|nr:hypothetical protein [Candidatus Staskawiczbacteria bacterium]
MKTLKTKQINFAVAWSFLKSIPPKEYDSMMDIERSVEIVNKLAEAIPEFVEHKKAGEDFNKKIIRDEIKDETEGDKVIKTAGQQIQEWHEAYDKKTDQLGDKQGNEVAEVEFDDAVFNTFFQFCNNKKWGAKTWFNAVPDYLGFLQDLNKANQQPKDR